MARIIRPTGCVPDKFADFSDKHVMRLGYSEGRVRDKEWVLVSCSVHATFGAFALYAEQWFNRSERFQSWGDMRGLALVTCLALLSGCAAVQTVTTDPQNQSITPDMRALDVHVGGRVKVEPLPAPMPAGAKAYLHEWPGVYFESAFKGRSVVLKFDDTYNEYRLLIDDGAPIKLAQPARAEVKIGGLGWGPHRLRLEKVTESIFLVGAFDGFYIPADGTPLAVKPRARQIEFIGASGESGYAAHATKLKCSYEEVRLTSDTQLAYPVLIAKHFNADYQINAYSGRGLIRNYEGVEPEQTMSLVYPFTRLNKTVPYADPAWQPQIIVIKLLTDLADVKPDGKWRNVEELLADYVKAYGDFIALLHRRSPSAAILIHWFDARLQPDPNAMRAVNAMQQNITDAAHKAGVARIEFVVMPEDLGLEVSACYHFTLKDHQKIAAWWIDYLDARPELWQGK